MGNGNISADMVASVNGEYWLVQPLASAVCCMTSLQPVAHMIEVMRWRARQLLHARHERFFAA